MIYTLCNTTRLWPCYWSRQRDRWLLYQWSGVIYTLCNTTRLWPCYWSQQSDRWLLYRWSGVTHTVSCNTTRLWPCYWSQQSDGWLPYQWSSVTFTVSCNTTHDLVIEVSTAAVDYCANVAACYRQCCVTQHVRPCDWSKHSVPAYVSNICWLCWYDRYH